MNHSVFASDFYVIFTKGIPAIFKYVINKVEFSLDSVFSS